MRRFFTLIGLLSSLLSTAQTSEIDLENFAERLFQIQDQNIAYEDIYESLLLFYTDPLNLNQASPEELGSLYILTPNQVSDFLRYRDILGNLLSIHELQAVPGFDLTTIRALQPFVTVDESTPDNRSFLERLQAEENNYLLLRYSRRLETQVGYTDAPLQTELVRDENAEVVDTITSRPTRYLGSPDKIYGRFRTSHRGDFSVGFTFEKDNGEQFTFSDKQRGFDFYSYHLLLENKWGLKKIMVGDFQLQVGQGLVFGAGFNAGKGAETINTVKRNTIGIRPYTSVLESGFFRGVGVTKQFNKWETTLFYSSLNQDGNIQNDSTYSDFEEFINSIQNTGFHRTPSEVASRNQIQEQSLGAVVLYRPARLFTIGWSGLVTRFSRPLQRRPNNYNQFEFKGDENRISSVFASYQWQNFTFFAEGAQSMSGGVGATGGLIASLSKAIDLAVLLRRFDRDFHSLYGNALSENSRIINEHGSYWGISYKPNRKHKLNAYYDRFRFPWLKFRTEAPSVGYEWLGRYSFFPTRDIEMYVQMRTQSRQVTLPEGNLNVLTDQLRRNYQFNIQYGLNDWLRFKTKVQSSTQQEGAAFTRGFVILQDLNLDFDKITIHSRVALFETDDFDNAQYVFENDVLYAFSIPAYFGTGVRSYIMLRYDPAKKLSFWLRYAQFNFRNQDTVGSGLDRAEGNISSEVKLMARIKF